MLSFFLAAFALSEQPASAGGGKPVAIELTSSAFQNGGAIPVRYTCEGENLSPPLAWSALPNGATSVALICDDPDAPAGTWVHWVLYNLPATATELREKVAPAAALPNGARQGTNSFQKIGYGGPCPPPGKAHRYFFKLYALDSELGLKSAPTKEELVQAMEHHILGEGQLMGTYQRKK